MFNERVRHVMARERLVVAAPQTSVREAARLMTETAASALLVVDCDRLAGIFTARDALRRVLACDRDPGDTPLAEVMTPAPCTVGPERLFGFALQLMQERGVRHLPVVEGQRAVGIVSARSVLDPEMEDFNCEALRREGFSNAGSPRS